MRLTTANGSAGLDLPSNLQGLWNNSNTPSWEADIQWKNHQLYSATIRSKKGA
jgi:hypothetical protein